MPARRASKVRAKAQQATALELRGEYGLAQAAALRTRLVPLLARAAPVVIDAAALTRIDASNLQLLTAFTRERHAKGRGVLWQRTPAWLADNAQRLGLVDALGLARS